MATVFSLIITRPSYFFRVSVIGVFIGDVSVIETVFHIISTLLNSTVKLSSMSTLNCSNNKSLRPCFLSNMLGKRNHN